jgi:hypothetical protein
LVLIPCNSIWKAAPSITVQQSQIAAMSLRQVLGYRQADTCAPGAIGDFVVEPLEGLKDFLPLFFGHPRSMVPDSDSDHLTRH